MMSSMPQAEREPGARRWETLTDWARARADWVVRPVARAFGRLGIHPNTLTIAGMLLQIGLGLLFALGHLRLAGLLLLVVAPLDVVDGTLARILGKQSRFGAFLDSTLDRLSDAVLILGLVAYDIQRQAFVEVALLLLSLVTVMMISYTRARAEALGFPCKVGVLTRMERVALIGVLSALGLHTVMAWALAVLSTFTMLQRMVSVYLVSLRREDGI